MAFLMMGQNEGGRVDEEEGEETVEVSQTWERNDSLRFSDGARLAALDRAAQARAYIPAAEEEIEEEPDINEISDGKHGSIVTNGETDTVAEEEEEGCLIPTAQDTPHLRNRPGPRSKPTPVELRLTFKKWKLHAEQSGERLHLQGSIMMVWRDPRILGLNLCRKRGVVPKHIWRPRLYHMQYKAHLTDDGVTIHHFDRAELQAIFTFQLNEDADDHAPNSTRLRTFPFDGFRYNFVECASDEICLDTAKDIDINFHVEGDDHLNSGSDERRKRKNTVMWYTSTTSGEHRLTKISYAIGTHTSPVNDWVYVDFAFSLHVERDRTYYINKVFTPLVVIFVYGLLAFTFPPFELEARLMLLATMYLTVFAIQWTCHDRLPRTPHATVVDEVVWNIVMALLAIAVGSCVSFRIALADGDTEDGYDIGWTGSRASKTDLGFMVVSILTMLLRGVYVWVMTNRYCTTNGSNIPFKNGAEGVNEKFQTTKGRAFRYDLETRTHTPVDNLASF